MRNLIFTLTFLTSIFAQAQILSQAQLNHQPPQNVLQNSGFERGLSKWGSSGVTPAVVTSGSNLLFDKASVTMDATAASQYIQSNLYTIPVGLQGANCEASIYYKGGDTNLKLEALDGSSNVLATRTFESAATYSRKFGVTFVCPTSGQFRLRVSSTADAALVALDSMHLGQFTTMEVSQASMIASGWFAATTNCDWPKSGATIGDHGTDTACPAITVEYQAWSGLVDATDTDLPQIKFNSLPPGNYRVQVQFTSGCDTAPCTVQHTVGDGTTDSGEVGRVTSDNNSANEFMTNLEGVFSYTTAGARTFKIRSAVSAGNVYLWNNFGNKGVSFKVYRYPLASEVAFRPDTIAWRVDANIGGANPSLGTSAVTSYTEITNASLDMVQNTGSLDVQIPCSSTNPSTGLTCSAGSESVGVVFNLPKAGSVLACASTTHGTSLDANDALNAAFQIVETPNNAQTISQEGKTRVASYMVSSSAATDQQKPIRICGTFNFSSAGQKTLRLMYEQAVTNTPNSSFLAADRDASVGQRDIHWEVYPIDQQIPAPLLVNSVVSPSSGVEQIVRASIAAPSGCTISSQSGSWLSTPTSAGAGRCAHVIAAGTFSATPSCSIVGVGASLTAHVCKIYSLSTSAIETVCVNVSDVGANIAREIICMGPK